MLAGILAVVFVGWGQSGESFDGRKFFSTVILGLIIDVPLATTTWASNAVLDTPMMINLFIISFLLGTETDFAKKKITSWAQGKVKNENT
jgi:hypothetical protein